MISEMPQVEAKACFTLSASARLLGIGRTTLYRLIADRLIKPQNDRCNGRPFLTGAQIVGFWKWHFKKN